MAEDLTNRDRQLLAIDIAIEDREPGQIPDRQADPTVTNASTEVSGVERFTDYANRYGEIYERATKLLSQVDLISKDVSVTPAGEISNLLAAIRRVFHKNSTEVTYEMYKHCLELRAQLVLEDSRSFMNTSVGVNND